MKQGYKKPVGKSLSAGLGQKTPSVKAGPKIKNAKAYGTPDMMRKGKC